MYQEVVVEVQLLVVVVEVVEVWVLRLREDTVHHRSQPEDPLLRFRVWDREEEWEWEADCLEWEE
jgi:hypothetical protein